MPYNDPPWHPITEPIDLKHLGKLVEEAGELAAVGGRCIIQGLDGINPDNKKVNREWLEEEIADVLASASLVVDHFKLNRRELDYRAHTKVKKLREWHRGA